MEETILKKGASKPASKPKSSCSGAPKKCSKSGASKSCSKSAGKPASVNEPNKNKYAPKIIINKEELGL